MLFRLVHFRIGEQSIVVEVDGRNGTERGQTGQQDWTAGDAQGFLDPAKQISILGTGEI
jgi:hypothetical protein